jgi:hypothetical protein
MLIYTPTLDLHPMLEHSNFIVITLQYQLTDFTTEYQGQGILHQHFVQILPTAPTSATIVNQADVQLLTQHEVVDFIWCYIPTKNQPRHDNDQNPPLNTNCRVNNGCTIKFKLLLVLYICIHSKREAGTLPIGHPQTMKTKCRPE